MTNWLDTLGGLAEQLPTGRKDPRALEKLAAEIQEQLAETDPVAKAMEGADVMYYAAKAVWNGLMTEEVAYATALDAATRSNLNFWKLFEIAVAKYRLRSRPGNPKDHQAEYQACAAALSAISGFQKEAIVTAILQLWNVPVNNTPRYWEASDRASSLVSEWVFYVWDNWQEHVAWVNSVPAEEVAVWVLAVCDK